MSHKEKTDVPPFFFTFLNLSCMKERPSWDVLKTRKYFLIELTIFVSLICYCLQLVEVCFVFFHFEVNASWWLVAFNKLEKRRLDDSFTHNLSEFQLFRDSVFSVEPLNPGCDDSFLSVCGYKLKIP